VPIEQLTPEQVRDWTRLQKDTWWLERVFRGDMPQLTFRAAVTGFLLGGILSATALYIAGKTGITIGVGVTSVVLAFAIFRSLARVGFAQDLTIEVDGGTPEQIVGQLICRLTILRITQLSDHPHGWVAAQFEDRIGRFESHGIGAGDDGCRLGRRWG